MEHTSKLTTFQIARLEKRTTRYENLLEEIERVIAEFRQLNFLKRVLAIAGLIEAIVAKIKNTRRFNEADMVSFPDPPVVKPPTPEGSPYHISPMGSGAKSVSQVGRAEGCG